MIRLHKGERRSKEVFLPKEMMKRREKRGLKPACERTAEPEGETLPEEG
jgi:hypothetical protein